MSSSNSCVLCPFRETGPLCGLEDETVGKFSDSLVRYSVSGKNKLVLHEGEPVHGLLFLCEGAVKLTKLFPSGEEVIIDLMTPCSIPSSIAVLGGIHQLSVVALQGRSEVAFLRVKTLAEMLSKFPEIQVPLLHYEGTLLDQMRNHLAMCHLPAPDRLMAMLVQLNQQFSPRPGIPFKLPLSLSELAQAIHTTPETVSRTLRRFQKEGLISMGRGRVVTILRPTMPIKRSKE